MDIDDDFIKQLKQLNIIDETLLKKIIDDDFEQLAELYINIMDYPYEQFQFCLSNSNLTLFDDTCHAQQYYEYIINNKDINYLESILINKIKINNQTIIFIEDILILHLINEYIDYLE